MLLGIDHLVIAVSDPEAAAAELERVAGLRCTGGGRHTTMGTYNRLSFLGDTYVELIGVFDRTLVPTSAVARAVQPALDAGRTGLVSFALASDDLEAEVAALRAAGSSLSAIDERQRTRPDGEVVRWWGAYPALGPAEPPFLIQHELVGAEWGTAARAERAAHAHPFGAPGRVAGIDIPVARPAEVADAYLRAVGLAFHPSGGADGDAWETRVGTQTIRLVAGEPLETPAVVSIDAAGAVEPRDALAVGVRWRIDPRTGRDQ